MAISYKASMIKLINLTKTVEYQLTSDPDVGTENATTFVLGALDARVMSVIKDKATAIPVSAFTDATNAMASLNINQTNLEVVQFGLKGFKNLQNDDGSQVEYKTAHVNLGGKTYLVCDPKIIEVLRDEDISELASKIMDINTLTEAERKNSAE
jgi:hypothetical protein